LAELVVELRVVELREVLEGLNRLAALVEAGLFKAVTGHSMEALVAAVSLVAVVVVVIPLATSVVLVALGLQGEPLLLLIKVLGRHRL